MLQLDTSQSILIVASPYLCSTACTCSSAARCNYVYNVRDCAQSLFVRANGNEAGADAETSASTPRYLVGLLSFSLVNKTSTQFCNENIGARESGRESSICPPTCVFIALQSTISSPMAKQIIVFSAVFWTCVAAYQTNIGDSVVYCLVFVAHVFSMAALQYILCCSSSLTASLQHSPNLLR